MHLNIPEGDFAGYIFDLDGTLVDTMPTHYRAWQEALRREGLRGALDEEYFYALAGVPSVRVAELLATHHGLRVDPVRVYQEKEEIYKASGETLELIGPVVDFAREVARGHPVSVASGGTRDVVTSTLGRTGLLPLFPILVTADDVTHGKPAPDMFLLAARLMRVEPRACLVFEDGQPGITAADAAGMRWVFVASRGAQPPAGT